MDSRVILAIETSNPSAGPKGPVACARGTVLAGPGVAIGLVEPAGSDGPGPIDAEPLDSAARHDDLMPAIDRLVTRTGIDTARIARVAVSVGPGGYTGVRIAVTTAAMIARALGGRVAAVPTPSVAAWACPLDIGPAVVCLASKRLGTHGTAFDDPAGKPLDGRDLGVIGADDLAQLGAAALIGDDHLPEPIRARARELGMRVIAPVLSAAGVLALGRLIEPIEPAAARPVYPRQPEAVTRWRQLHP